MVLNCVSRSQAGSGELSVLTGAAGCLKHTLSWWWLIALPRRRHNDTLTATDVAINVPAFTFTHRNRSKHTHPAHTLCRYHSLLQSQLLSPIPFSSSLNSSRILYFNFFHLTDHRSGCFLCLSPTHILPNPCSLKFPLHLLPILKPVALPLIFELMNADSGDLSHVMFSR